MENPFESTLQGIAASYPGIMADEMPFQTQRQAVLPDGMIKNPYDLRDFAEEITIRIKRAGDQAGNDPDIVACMGLAREAYRQFYSGERKVTRGHRQTSWHW